MVDIPGSGKNKIPSDYPGVATYEKYLLECKWKGISFPITNLHTELKQDLVEHKYPDRDGAHVEATGRSPLRVTAKALFYNNTSKGKSESWKFGVLFPTTYLQFVDVCKDRSTGQLQHPILGTFDAKLVTMNTELDAERRDGVAVNLEWVETIKIETFDEVTVDKPTTVSADAQALDDLLSKKSSLPPLISEGIDNKVSFTDLVDGVKALIDTTTLIGLKALAAIDKVLYHINNLLFSIDRLNSVLLADLKSKAQALKASMQALRETVNNKLGEIRFFVVPRDITIGELASHLGNNIVDLIRLNPQIATKPVILRLTPVKYYKLV